MHPYWKRAVELPINLIKNDRHEPKPVIVLSFRSSPTLIHVVRKGVT